MKSPVDRGKPTNKHGGKVMVTTDRRRLLELALRGLEMEQREVAQEMAAIRTALRTNGHTPTAHVSVRQSQAAGALRNSPHKGRTISEAHRRKIALAMKRRWAERRK